MIKREEIARMTASPNLHPDVQSGGRAFNRDQVKLREGRLPAELREEARANIQRDIQAC